MTPRAAMLDVCAGRAICISFFRPDDVEAAEAISPAIMFRQWGILILEGRPTQWSGVGRNTEGLDSVFRLVGGAAIPPWKVGGYSRYSWCAKPAQRCTFERLAVWTKGCAAMAYGWANRAIASALRQVRQSLFGLDRCRKDARHAGVSCKDGRGRGGYGEPLAGATYDARYYGRVRLSVSKCGQHITGSEWMAI